MMCADSTDKDTVLNFLGGEKPDMILTDPPYKMTYSGGGCFSGSTNRTSERLQKLINFKADTIAFYRELDIPSVYIFTSRDLIRDYLEQYKRWSGTILVWCKTNPTPFCASSHLPDIEYLLYFRDRGAVFNGGMKPMSIYSRYYVSAKEEGKREAGDVHPTVKPLTLLKNKILISSKPDGIAFDGFGGSGSTLIAAEMTGRRCYMTECEEEYCRVIIDRWEKLTGKKAAEVK